MAAPHQRDIQRLLDLPQILIERPAQIGKPRIVVARCYEFEGSAFGGT
jgi:hypothetical protein